MSSFLKITKHPKTGKFETAAWIDDFYGPHQYGVQFTDWSMYRPQDIETIEGPTIGWSEFEKLKESHNPYRK